MKIDIEGMFGDVHADVLSYALDHLFHVLCLSSGASPPGIRSGHREKKRGGQTLARPHMASMIPTHPLLPWRARGLPWQLILPNRLGHQKTSMINLAWSVSGVSQIVAALIGGKGLKQ